MKLQHFLENITKICEEALKSVSAKVISVYPETRFRMGHSANAAFPARFWGSFIDLTNEHQESVDIAIDFKWGEQAIEIITDVAYESGEILSDLPIQYIPLRDTDNIEEAEATETVNKVTDYVCKQWDLIGRALQKEM